MILHLAWVFGGAERTTSNLLRYLDRQLVTQITLVAPETLRRQLPNAYDNFIDTERFGLVHGHFVNSGIFRAESAAVAAILERSAPDIALGMMHYSAALIVLGTQLTTVPVKTIASYRGPIDEYLRRFEPDKRRAAFLRAAVTGTTLLADRVVVPSQGIKQEMVQQFQANDKETIVIPNGINFLEANEAARQPVAVLSRLDRSRPLLCTAARLAPEKNLQLLLTAICRVQEVRPVTLMIIGDGPDYGALKDQAAALGLQKSVIFLGYQKNCYPYFRCADLFIHTCLYEGFGYTMLEAMAVGTPVIATDCPYGPREIIANNEYGLLVPPDDFQALAEAILLLLQHAQLREILARRGMERAKTFSIEKTISQYEAVFKTISKI